MNSSTHPPAAAQTSTSQPAVDSSTRLLELGLSLATAPVLLCLIAARAFSDKLHDLGQMSEEVFRGDRLPVLTVPNSTTVSTDSDNAE